jgi:hypothetical protein
MAKKTERKTTFAVDLDDDSQPLRCESHGNYEKTVAASHNQTQTSFPHIRSDNHTASLRLLLKCALDNVLWYNR